MANTENPASILRRRSLFFRVLLAAGCAGVVILVFVLFFGVGRWLGAHYVRTLVSQETWDKMGFIVEAEGAILCFIIYLVPGLPKDMVCYLFGISPMPLWVFTLVSTLGRMPGTWVLSAQGAHTAAGDYLQVILLTAVVVAVALPLYYYRNRIVSWFRGRSPR